MEIKRPSGIGDILKSRKTLKPPSYVWQDLALRAISELSIPPFKKSAVFKVCRDNPPQRIINAINDTKELCQSVPTRWKYFLKIISNKDQKRPE